MTKLSSLLVPLAYLIVATGMGVSGDALVRMGIHKYVGFTRIGLFLIGGILLFGYGATLNLAPVTFGQVVGLYIAALFIMWQLANIIFFHTIPTLPILSGGTLIIIGGLIVTFWNRTS